MIEFSCLKYIYNTSAFDLIRSTGIIYAKNTEFLFFNLVLKLNVNTGLYRWSSVGKHCDDKHKSLRWLRSNQILITFRFQYISRNSLNCQILIDKDYNMMTCCVNILFRMLSQHYIVWNSLIQSNKTEMKN